MTAADDGCVKLWNFNSGALLRQFLCKGPPVTLTCLLFAAADEEDGGSDLVATPLCSWFPEPPVVLTRGRGVHGVVAA